MHLPSPSKAMQAGLSIRALEGSGRVAMRSCASLPLPRVLQPATAAPPDTPHPSPSPRPALQLPKTYSFMVRYSFLWRFAFTTSQPRIMHVPTATASAAFVGQRISEAFDLYHPDLVVSVHPLMQVCGWGWCVGVRGQRVRGGEGEVKQGGGGVKWPALLFCFFPSCRPFESMRSKNGWAGDAAVAGSAHHSEALWLNRCADT